MNKIKHSPNSKNWRHSKEYRVWRILVIRRDKKCVICGSIKYRNVHHLNHASYFKNQRFDVNNGITLCGKHHRLFHYLYIGNTRKKCTREQFIKFLKILKEGENVIYDNLPIS